jgi:hypothetical protein
MLAFDLWRDLALAFVRQRAVAAGWSVCVEFARSTRSVYVKLQRGSERACVRLSDHRCRWQGPRMLCVRQRSTGRLRVLDSFLQRGRVDDVVCNQG